MSKMMRILALILVVAVISAFAAPAGADAVSEQRKAQNKLLAYRAARVDGMRKLAERIHGLSITSTTTVKDFVAESDEIETNLEAFLLGARESGKPTYNEDGTCEVTMAVTLEEVVVTLKRLHKQHYKGNKVRYTDIEKMNVTTEKKIIKETGMGAPRPELAEDAIVPVAIGSLNKMKYMSNPAKAYWLAHCTGQGRLMAVRSARVEALRRLGERIQGVMINSTTSVRDFVAESDDINTNMTAFIRGAEETGIMYHEDEMIVEVELTVTLREVLVNLKTWAKEHYRGNKVVVEQVEELTTTVKDKKISETGMGIPPAKYLKAMTPVDTAAVSVGTASMKWPNTVRVTGDAAISTASGHSAAQAKLMALRAAELDGRRKLGEELDGLVIDSRTTVRDFVAENDEIETSMLTFQQSAYVVDGSQSILEDGTVQVIVEIDLDQLRNMVIHYSKTTVAVRK
ncbi:MAG TPA: hypothetical protein ENL03_05270 [Phycisphaerae bacterium]|nr:hypothetical protein [Phycisphaerae bacterium]